MECFSVSPRLPLGGDDEFVVKVALEGPEGAESTWDPVARVFDCAPAVLRKELKTLRLKVEQKEAIVQRYGLRLWSYCSLGGVPDSEFLIFGFIRVFSFSAFWLVVFA